MNSLSVISGYILHDSGYNYDDLIFENSDLNNIDDLNFLFNDLAIISVDGRTKDKYVAKCFHLINCNELYIKFETNNSCNVITYTIQEEE